MIPATDKELVCNNDDAQVGFVDSDKKYTCFFCLHIKNGGWLIGAAKTLGYGAGAYCK